MTLEPTTASTLVEEHDETQVRNLEAKALKGTYFVTLAYGAAQVLRLVSSIVLSHLFAPDLFGVMALVNTVIVGLNLISHLGLQDSVVQHPRGDESTFVNTAWTLQVIRGAGLFAITLPIAWPVAHFYHEPRLLWLLPALGLGCLISGFSSPSLLVLSRHLGVAKIVGLELFQQTLQFLITMVWAYFQPSLIALAAGRLLSEVLRDVATYWVMPELRPRFMWEEKAVHDLIHFGKWILVGTALTFLAMQSDRLILAKLISFQMLGVYGIAFSLSDLPRQVILQFCGRIAFPFMAKFAQRPRDEYRAVLQKYRAPVLAVGGLLLILVICTGDQFILHVYDQRYHEAAWMIGLLTIGLWHTLLYSTINPAILSLQKAHYNAIGYLVYCVALYSALPLGYHWMGMPGAVLAVAFSDLPVYFVTLYSAYREKVGLFLQDVWLTIAFVAALVGALALRHALGFGSPFARLHW